MVRPRRPAGRDREPDRADETVEVLAAGREAPQPRPPGRVAADRFGFVQLEFGFLLGPPDGRYLLRPEAGGPVEAVLVLRTLGAPQRRLLRGRRGRMVDIDAPEPVPTSRATLVAPEPFGDLPEAQAWLAGLRRDRQRAQAELDSALRRLNRALHAQRVASADPFVRDVSAVQALVARIGYGSGDETAEGRFAEAWELPRGRRRTRRSMEAPEERFAAILGGREAALPGEELVLRARADLDAGREREAALEARVALEALLAGLPGEAGGLEQLRPAVGEAANAALSGALPEELETALADAIEAMEAALRRRRLDA